jgi:hypothetical protein
MNIASNIANTSLVESIVEVPDRKSQNRAHDEGGGEIN